MKYTVVVQGSFSREPFFFPVQIDADSMKSACKEAETMFLKGFRRAISKQPVSIHDSFVLDDEGQVRWSSRHPLRETYDENVLKKQVPNLTSKRSYDEVIESMRVALSYIYDLMKSDSFRRTTVQREDDGRYALDTADLPAKKRLDAVPNAITRLALYENIGYNPATLDKIMKSLKSIDDILELIHSYRRK